MMEVCDKEGERRNGFKRLTKGYTIVERSLRIRTRNTGREYDKKTKRVRGRSHWGGEYRTCSTRLKVHRREEANVFD